ncbi:MAG: hypothetical protein KC910_06000, partial [Candidatus Eremiobacteraeota bacterium]|nr:hypothetical protein [Candidatus Eremiobacteraeota bacterium]
HQRALDFFLNKPELPSAVELGKRLAGQQQTPICQLAAGAAEQAEQLGYALKAAPLEARPAARELLARGVPAGSLLAGLAELEPERAAIYRLGSKAAQGLQGQPQRERVTAIALGETPLAEAALAMFDAVMGHERPALVPLVMEALAADPAYARTSQLYSQLSPLAPQQPTRLMEALLACPPGEDKQSLAQCGVGLIDALQAVDPESALAVAEKLYSQLGQQPVGLKAAAQALLGKAGNERLSALRETLTRLASGAPDEIRLQEDESWVDIGGQVLAKN